MSSTLCKHVLDQWVIEHYDHPETALGKWKRTAKYKNSNGFLCRRFYNRILDVTMTVIQEENRLHVIAPDENESVEDVASNGYEFELVEDDHDDGSVCFHVARVGYPDDPGNRHNGDCNGNLPSGMFEISESLYESNFDHNTTLKLLKRAGFVKALTWSCNALKSSKNQVVVFF